MLQKLLITLLVLFACCAHSAAPPDNHSMIDGLFNVEEATQRFNQLTSNVSTENIQLKSLNQSIDELKDMARGASECVDLTSTEIDKLNTQIQLFVDKDSETPKGVDIKYLEQQKKMMTERQAQCRLFLIRANETIKAYQQTAISLQQEIIFTRGDHILTRLNHLLHDWQRLNLPQVDSEQVGSLWHCLGYLILLMSLAVALALRLKRHLGGKGRIQKMSFLLQTSMIFLFLLGLSHFLFFPKPFADKMDNQLLSEILLLSMVFTTILFAYHFLFLLKRIPRLLEWYGFDVVFLKQVGMTVIGIYFTRKIGLECLILIDATDNIIRIYEDLILVIALIAMSYFTLILYHKHSTWFKDRFSGAMLYKLLFVIVATLIVLDIVGFYVLAVNAAYILFAFMLVSALGVVLFLGVSNIYHMLCYKPYYQMALKRLFGYIGEPPFIEILLLKILAQIVIFITMCLIFARLIGEARYFINNVLEYFTDGFQVAGLEIIPLQWLFGLFIFSLFALFSRHIAKRISLSQQFNEEETQVAFASITLYVGITVSVIMGLLMAGFSFTSLTIIAGALSVGVGLGLQSIVNNFFSGLILLIEKPIKVGDRIKIDNIEGFVKKVRVRSTHILTPLLEDIIIPNSDLITHQVINYMYSDRYYRVNCEVGVAYGSDTDKVSQVMIDVALAHPEVVKDKRHKPMVIFRAFGDSALMFEMWCLIKDVNKKLMVTSELNFALDKAFREHDIDIAFPQRDVNIKFEQSELLSQNKTHDTKS